MANSLIKKYSAWLAESLITEEDLEKSLTKRVNFPSGYHSAAASKLDVIMAPQLKEIETFLVTNKGQVIQIELAAGESQVPNYDAETKPQKTKLNPGDLSLKRYATIKTYMTTWLEGLKTAGTIAALPEFKESTPVIGTTPWAPPANSTPEQIKALANDPKYTAEQYLQVTLRVVATKGPDFEDSFTKVAQQTNRSAYSALSNYNTALFYNYSVAPAAVLGKDPATLPGALLTMNRLFEARIPMQIAETTVPRFKVMITPNGGQTVKLLCLPSGIKTPERVAQSGGWEEWYAEIAPSYNLTVGFKEGTPQFKYAWMFIYWYINSSFPADWKYIANKPAGVDFNALNKMQSIANYKNDSSLQNQQTQWAKVIDGMPMKTWYAKEVQEYYK